MANFKKKDPDQRAIEKLEYIAKSIRGTLREKGISKYAFCVNNGFNRNSFERMLKAKKSYTLQLLFDYLDAAGLELKIEKKQES